MEIRDMLKVLVNATVVILLQYVSVSPNRLVNLKLAQCYMLITSQ